MPLVLLSGFLGTGKTTLLKHWLENAEGGRVGVVVNDVAAVNIDAKLIKPQAESAQQAQVDTIQLDNGCACCSLGDELLVTISDLLRLSGKGDRPFDRIVVELSGVAEPKRVKELVDQAKAVQSPLTEGIGLPKVVTVVDASTFCKDYMEFKTLMERPDLTDFTTDAAYGNVGTLLVEQVEEADVVVLNKSDLANDEELAATESMVKAVNKQATVRETSFGKVLLSEVLGEEQHEHGHACSHDHGHEAHGHSEEAHAHEESGHAHKCGDPTCTDPSHDHGDGHGHAHAHDEACSDVNCTDPSHDHGHEHGHSHSHGPTTAEERFGITSFIYTARRPFDNNRLDQVLREWPIPKEDSLHEVLGREVEDSSDDVADDDRPHVLSKVMRSKGFCWLAEAPLSMLYWSHAGKSMSIQQEGRWWAALTDVELKAAQLFRPGEYERVQKEDWKGEYGDRRQELVFIGQGMDEAAIRSLLDKALVTDEEMDRYRKLQEEDMRENEEWMAKHYSQQQVSV